LLVYIEVAIDIYGPLQVCSNLMGTLFNFPSYTYLYHSTRRAWHF